MEELDSAAGGDEYRRALTTVRAARNVFGLLILLAVGIQLASLVLVRFVDVLDETPGAATRPAAEPATQPSAPASSAGAARTWALALGWAMAAGKFTALAAGMLLVLTLMFAVKLALHGQTGGVAAFLSAFFWSLVLWVFLVPWQQALPGSTVLCGAMSNLGDLTKATARATGPGAGWSDQVFYYARFAAYPLLAGLLWLLVHVKYARGHRRAMGASVAEVSPVAAAEQKV